MSRLRGWWSCAWVALVACGGASDTPARPPVQSATIPAASSTTQVIAEGSLPVRNDGPIPVTADDPTWGAANAPVTLVMFGDFECPYSAKAARTVEALQNKYGPDRLRVAFKHNPLPHRKIAPFMHEEAANAHKAGGNTAFWAYFHYAYVESNRADGFEVIRERALGAASEASPELERKWSEVSRAGSAEKVATDLALGKESGVRGVPAFFINGVSLAGAQEQSKFEDIIEAELTAARPALASGGLPANWYALRSSENVRKAPPPDAKKPPVAPPPPDLTVWKVPVGKSPVRGPANALVTVVMFADFECPFSARALTTLEELRKRHPDDLRIVFKHQPLPFHKKAEPAHQLAQEIFEKKGAEAFWKAHDTLFENRANLDEATLTKVATEAGLNAPAALTAVRSKKHKRVIDEDRFLAEDLEATSTPHFFINGRKLVGSQPIEKFTEIVDERLAVAKSLAQGGVARDKVYDTLLKDGRGATALVTKQAPPVPADAPSRGAKTAPVTIQIFGDLECPFTRRLLGTMPEIEKEFPGKLRVVWRNLPLPLHKNAKAGAIAALEVRRAKGDVGFWKMLDALVVDKGQWPEGYEAAAGKAGVSADALRAAMGASPFGKVVDADADAAAKLELRSTPSVFVNDFFISGAHELKLKRAIKRALDSGPRAKP